MKAFVLWPYYLPVLHAQGISLSPPRSENESQELLCHKEEVQERLKLQFPLYSSQFSYSFMTNSLRPHGLYHASPPCPSPSPRACSNSCPWSRWCHPTISLSVIPFSYCLQFSPASGSFWMSQFFASGGQSIGASTSVLPMNFQDWFPSGSTGLISLHYKGLSRVFSNTTVWKHQFFSAQCSLWPNSILDYWKNHSFN